MTTTATPTVTPQEAAQLVQSGQATIIDVREPDEHRRQHVAKAALHPSSTFRVAAFTGPESRDRLLVLCRSGGRATKVATDLRNAGRANVSVISGGIVEWERAGLPVITDTKAPLPIMRQVMMTVGVMLMVFTTLAATVSPWFLVGTGFMGVGLFFAGATGICMLSTVLLKMPWNRATACSTTANCCSK